MPERRRSWAPIAAGVMVGLGLLALLYMVFRPNRNCSPALVQPFRALCGKNNPADIRNKRGFRDISFPQVRPRTAFPQNRRCVTDRIPVGLGEELARRYQAARRREPGGVGGGKDYAAGGGKDHAAGGGNYHAACGGEEDHGKSGRNRGGLGGKPGRGGGRTGDGASNGTEYWTNIIGGTTMLTGLFALLYKTFDLGTLWRDKVNGIWGGVLDYMCHNYVEEPGAGLRINDSRLKWTAGSLLEEKPPSPSETCQATIIIELEDDD